jgi:hypothetical protein
MIGGFLPSSCLATIGEFISLLSFFQNKESRATKGKSVYSV